MSNNEIIINKEEIRNDYFKKKENANAFGRNVDAIIVIDRSSSTGDYNRELNEALLHMFRNLKQNKTVMGHNVYITIILFNHEHETVLRHMLINDLTEEKIPNIESEGATNPAPALEEGIQIGASYYECYVQDGVDRAHPILYYFTDGWCDAGVYEGQSASERDATKQKEYEDHYTRVCNQIQELIRNHKITVVACGFTQNAKIDEIQRMTDLTCPINDINDVKQMDTYFSKLIPATTATHLKKLAAERITKNEFDNILGKIFPKNVW